MRIDSPSNPRITSALRAVERGERMLLEGPRTLEEALEAGIVPEEIFFEGEEGLALSPAVRRAAERGASLVPVSSRVLRKLSDLASARGLAATAHPPARTLPDLLLSKQTLVVLLDGVQDPANVGAILRSAEAFGASAVLLTSGTASPFSPKALRASALSALRVPIVSGVDAFAAVAWASARGALLAGAQARGGEPPEDLRGVRPLVLVIGSEGHGISAALTAALSRRVTIPLGGKVESLNAAVAAAVLLDRLTRQPG
jgi:RNA methyltransferase, TrmH family